MSSAPPQSARRAARPSGGRHRVLIIGGGFGGLYAARGLGRDDRVDVTLVDRQNHHLFQPLLYQVATGALAPGEIAQPLRSVLRRQRNTTVLLGEAVGIEIERREVVLSDGGPIPFDTLIVATGATFSYFGNEGWAPFAPGLKTIDDATEIRRRILVAFEAAEREGDEIAQHEWMSFVIVGAGPTGVELAGALGEIAHDTLRRDFRRIHPPAAQILLVEGLERVLPAYPPDRSRSARRQLEMLGVTVRTGARVVGVDAHGVDLETTDGRVRVAARTVLWAAGVRSSTFARTVAAAAGSDVDRSGRVLVAPDLTLRGHPEVLVIGDAAVQPWLPDRPAPGVAQGAIQAGQYAARSIGRRLSGEVVEPFRYQDRGDVAVIGRVRGVTNIPWLGRFGRQGGIVAWALWLGIHIAYLIGFANRVVVLVRWGWTFATHGRGSRLITGRAGLPPIEDPAPPG